MKKIITMSLLACGLAFAQAGIQGGTDGIHQYNTKTNGQLGFSIGTGGNIALDAWALSRGGTYTANGKTYGFNDWAPSLSGNFNASVGLYEFVDLGLNLPLYYEHAKSDGPSGGGNMWTTSRGDLDVWFKVRIPFDSQKRIFTAAVQVDAYVPSGEEAAGVRPRHAWYLNSNGETHPFTSNAFGIGGNLILTLDLVNMGIPVRWNGNAGIVYTVDHDLPVTMVYGTGINVMPLDFVDIFVEFSGEFRVEETGYPRSPLVDPMLLTPGFRFHLPWNVDFAMGLDIAVRALRNFTFDGDKEMEHSKDYKIHYVGENDVDAYYYYTPTPLYAGTASLVWRFDGNSNKKPQDEDKDGVPDVKDKCPHTLSGVAVDVDGCPMDTDKDGVPDGLDKCPNTAAGVTVDSVGCPMDADKDGVPDGLDKCPNTKEGRQIDATGCESDFDKDGIPDADDRCPNTKAGVPVDSTGCAADSDHDGVPDNLDKCPGTKEGAEVNDVGCEGDRDGDGVPDAMDKCPNTKAGMPVDSTGCTADADKDGVPDALDKCPNTPEGTTVDSTGCVSDFDKDGVSDDLDKCPNTKEGTVVDSTGCPIDSDRDGVFDGIDKCPNTEKDISVDSTGCPMDIDHDGVPDHQDKCPYTLEGVKVDAKGCPLNKKQDLNKLKQGIQFQTNSTKFTKDSYGTLNDIVALLKQIPSANLEVQGHTDNVGKPEANKELSQARAQAVVDYFVQQGVASDRLRAVGFGDEKPIASNGSKHGRKQNRRVELIPFEK